jgi:hypothetical protein
MSFHYYRQKSKVDEANRFQVKENGKVVIFEFSDSLRYNEEYRIWGRCYCNWKSNWNWKITSEIENCNWGNAPHGYVAAKCCQIY